MNNTIKDFNEVVRNASLNAAINNKNMVITCEGGNWDWFLYLHGKDKGILTVTPEGDIRPFVKGDVERAK